MQTELKCLEETKTWSLVKRPSQKNVIPGKWVYKVKTKADGSIEKYKARYVAKGFKQIEGIDYSETFAPTSKPETFRTILSLAAKENFTLRQLDVKSAYLHPEIKEEIYLEQPTGFEKLDSSGNKLVCKLNKSIYGLKQAAKNWYEELAKFLIQQNFKRSKNDYCLFTKIDNKNKLFVLSWVDDLVIAGSNENDIEELKKTLEGKFKMDDRGKLEWFLGMQISQERDKITLDQEKYIENVIEKFGMQDSNPSKTPAENNLKLVKAADNEQLVDEKLYRSLVGSLLYIAKQTRPDIVWIVNVLSRFMTKPTNTHWLAGKRVLRYLQATKSLKLIYPRDSDFKLQGESDADWSGDQDDRRSTTGYFFKLGSSGGAISWQTKKQQTVALSSCEAEYQGLAAAVQEATFLRSLMCDLGYEQTAPTLIGEDNQSCIKLATNPVMHKRSKHIDTKYHFIRDKIEEQSVELVYTPSDQLAADLLTKSLPQIKVEQHRKNMMGH